MDTMRTTLTKDVSVATVFMRQVYLWMSAGLGLTALTAWSVANSDFMVKLLFSHMAVPIVLIIAQVGLVVVLSAAIQRMSAAVATGLFVLYATLTGVTLSSIFLTYEIGNIANAFIVTAGTFLAMSVYGFVTKRDLTGMGSFLMMGLFGIIIAMIVNIFLQSPVMDFVISGVGVLIFTGFTAYDTQRIKEFGSSAPLEDGTAVRRGVILGALTLYLDFINLFLMMLRLMSGNRD